MLAMQAIILSIGDELTLGQTVDSNSAFLSARLVARGILTTYHQTLPDDLPTITRAIREASGQAELLLITGGLGPTVDDLTRQALAEAMGQPLELHEPSVDDIRAFFEQRGRAMPEANKVQAMCPRTATPIPNDWGTAPGIEASLGSAKVYVMPGVPREMGAMFEHRIEPRLAALQGVGRVILAHRLNTAGIGESDVGMQLGELMDRSRNPTVGTTAASGFVSIRIRSEAGTRQAAQALLDDTVRQLHERLGEYIVSEGDVDLSQVVVRMLEERGRTLTLAESCTGGLIAERITDTPGSSNVFVGGWVTYSNAMKQEQLGVNGSLLEEHGAVSLPVAEAMAIGALRHAAADYALAVTGLAGPHGGSEEKPVGTVCFALAFRREGQPAAESVRMLLPGDRTMVRERATRFALDLLRKAMLRTDRAV